jgi:hypothetical protein
MDADQPVRVRVSPLAYLAGIFAAVVLTTMVVLLVVQLTVLTDQRRLLESQEAKITRLDDGTQPLLRDAAPAVDEAQPLLHRVRTLLRPAADSLESVSVAADELPPVLQGVDVLVAHAIPLLQSLERAELIPRTSHALGRFEELLSESVETQKRTLRVQRRTLRVQLASFRTQRRTARMFAESLGIQRETLEHARSIDRKTGPAPPATPVTP